MSASEQVARILRTDSKVIDALDTAVTDITGKKSVLQGIVDENENRMNKIIQAFNVTDVNAENLYRFLIHNLKVSNTKLFKLMGQPTFMKPGSFDNMIRVVKDLAGNPSGFFLKEEVAKRMLRAAPPPNIIAALDYTGVEELIEKEDIRQVYAALRFIETRDWMNMIFVKEYEKLTPDDFEERSVEVTILPKKWLDLARKFVEKKYHNVSHLKELGLVFVIPIQQEGDGAILRLFGLLLHYMYEVPFYSKLIKKYAKKPDTFTENVMSLIRGDVLELKADDAKDNWMIVQRYLSKDDKNDPRLFIPHVNPEAIHWEKAEDAMARFGEQHPDLNLQIWRGLDWVGYFYATDREGEVLVSFNLIDNIMSLVMEKELIKYLYHQQESLWNKLFKEYYGKENLESAIIDNFELGQISYKL